MMISTTNKTLEFYNHLQNAEVPYDKLMQNLCINIFASITVQTSSCQ